MYTEGCSYDIVTAGINLTARKKKVYSGQFNHLGDNSTRNRRHGCGAT